MPTNEIMTVELWNEWITELPHGDLEEDGKKLMNLIIAEVDAQDFTSEQKIKAVCNAREALLTL